MFYMDPLVNENNLASLGTSISDDLSCDSLGEKFYYKQITLKYTLENQIHLILCVILVKQMTAIFRSPYKKKRISKAKPFNVKFI